MSLIIPHAECKLLPVRFDMEDLIYGPSFLPEDARILGQLRPAGAGAPE